MKKLLLYFSVFCFYFTPVSAQIITTIVGIDTVGYSGDGGPATAAEINAENCIITDNSGNLYFTDASNCAIRKVNTSGIITTIAGTGHYGYNGDGGQATNAELATPGGIVMDDTGNIYFADSYNSRLRKINTAGIISTFAGNGFVGYSGDGGPATAAELSAVLGLARDSSGNFYAADYGGFVIRKISSSGIISTIAGIGANGYDGDTGPATAAEISGPWGITVDNTGNVYIADWKNNRIRVINTSGIINTVVGNGTLGYSGDGGQATAAQLRFPTGIKVDAAGELYVTDRDNSVLRVVNTSGIISTIAGNGDYGFSGDGGMATDAELAQPLDICLDLPGTIYISDQMNNRIRKLTFNPSAINELEDNAGEVSVYPNPSNGRFVIQLPVAHNNWSIEIYNVLGEKVFSQFNISARTSSPGMGGQQTTFSIDLSSRPAGIYLYHVLNETGELEGQGKIVIER